MASKGYTAQEMRLTAEYIYADYGVARIPISETPLTYRDVRGWEIAAMLRQAADMMERCVKARSRHSLYYGKLDHEDETEIVNEIDYIIHGDTRKEHDDGE